MQRNIWMRPALQQSEAVMMPALQRRRVGEAQFSDLYYHPQATEDPFRPVVNEETVTTTALSTYVRPQGGMGGRGLLRAVGISPDPMTRNGRPTYFRSRFEPRGFMGRNYFR